MACRRQDRFAVSTVRMTGHTHGPFLVSRGGITKQAQTGRPAREWTAQSGSGSPCGATWGVRGTVTLAGSQAYQCQRKLEPRPNGHRRKCRFSHSARSRQRILRVILPRFCRLPGPADYCHSNKCPRGVSAVNKAANFTRQGMPGKYRRCRKGIPGTAFSCAGRYPRTGRCRPRRGTCPTAPRSCAGRSCRGFPAGGWYRAGYRWTGFRSAA